MEAYMQKLSVKAQHQEPASDPAEQLPHVVDHAARLAELGAKQAELRAFLQKAELERTDLLIDGAPDAQIEAINQAIGRAKQRAEAISLQIADIQRQISAAGRAKKAATFAAMWPGYAEKLTKFVSDVKSIHTAREELIASQNQMLGTLGFAALDCCAVFNPDAPLSVQTIEDFERRAQIALAMGNNRLGKEWPE